MRAQLSLELLVYVALAGISLAFALSAAAAPLAKAGYELRAYGIAQFVDEINSALLQHEYGSGFFYLPSGLCPSSVQGNELVTAYGEFALAGPVAAYGSVFCPDGMVANMSIGSANGTALLERG